MVCIFPAISFFSYLWSREHYRFFVVVLPVVLWMIWEEMPLRPVRLNGLRRFLGWSVFSLTTVLLSLTAVIASSWLCGFALFMVLLTTAIFAQESKGRFNLFGISGIFLLLLPLPLNYDLLLIQWLQGWTSHQAGQVLEVFGVWHLMRGNLLLLEDKTFFIEEACAGVHSLFALIASASLFSGWTKRNAASSMLLIFLTVPWALLTNVARICTVTMGWYLLQINLAAGWKHEVLGAILFVCACLLCWSTALLIRFFVSPSAAESWMQGLSPGVSPRVQPESRSSATNSEASGQPGIVWIGAFSVFAVALTVMNIARSPYLKIHYNDRFVQSLNGILDKETIGDQLTPGLALTGYDVKDRELMSSWGKHSRVWKLSGQSWNSEFSVDYLWQHQHDLTWCYGGVGWEIANEKVSDADPAWPLVILQLNRLSGEKAVVLYSLLDTDGEMFFSPTRRTIGSELAGRMRFELNRIARFKDGVIQIQMYIPNTEADDPVVAEIQGEYRKLREVIRQQVNGIAGGIRSK